MMLYFLQNLVTTGDVNWLAEIGDPLTVFLKGKDLLV